MAFGNSTFANAGGAVSDILGGYATAKGLRLKATGDRAEADLYDIAGNLAQRNEAFSRESTAVKLAQQERESLKIIGGQEADVAGAGFAASGTALDLLRDSTSQAALSSALLQRQGLITEEGYHEQARSYQLMAGASRYAASVEDDMAGDAERNGWITGGIKGAAAIASLFF